MNRLDIPVSQLMLDTGNFRIRPQESQPEAIRAIVAEQGEKLVVIARDIASHGLSPLDLLAAYPSGDGSSTYVAVEGNRRVAAIKCALNPDLALGTRLHKAFTTLNKQHADHMPDVIPDVVVFPDKQSAMLWIERRHSRDMRGAGIEPWSAEARDRADAYKGRHTPAKDAREYVLSNARLEPGTRDIIAGRGFSTTNLSRLLGTKHVRDGLGLTSSKEGLVSTMPQDYVLAVLTEVVTIIASKRYRDQKFNVNTIRSASDRSRFFDEVAARHGKPSGRVSPWQVSGEQALASPVDTPAKKDARHARDPKTTDQRKSIVPTTTRIAGLPQGKVADVFRELKKLPVDSFPHAGAVLLRMFIELSADSYLKRHNISSGSDKLVERLKRVRSHLRDKQNIGEKALKSLDVTITDKHSYFSTHTLNQYVHDEELLPIPTNLKRTWSNLERVLVAMWSPGPSPE